MHFYWTDDRIFSVIIVNVENFDQMTIDEDL